MGKDKDQELRYWDEQFVNVVRASLMDDVMQGKRRIVSSDMTEAAAGVVVMNDRFFYDPKRWAFRDQLRNVDTDSPLVEARCEGAVDVGEVIGMARDELKPLKKGLKWRDDILE